MFAVAIPFIIVTSIVVGVRLHARVFLVEGGVGLDDALMFAGAVFNIGLSIANMICAWYGAGAHAIDIKPENLVPLLKANLATRLLYLIALCLVKFSILVFYLRLDHRKVTKWVIYFLMFTVAGLSIATFFILLLICNPTSLYWNPVAQALHPEKCWSTSKQQTFYNAHGILNIVQDAAIYVLPMPMLWRLQVPRRQKLALVALLSFGLISVAAGCVRFYYVLFLASEADLWWYMADSLNWCSIEIHVAIICGCASTFKIVLRTYLPRLWGSSMGSSAETPRHQYNQSHSGQFAMQPYGTNASKKSTSNRKYGLSDLTTLGNDSEEHIVTSPNQNTGSSEEWNNGIKMSKDITVQVTEAPLDTPKSRNPRGW